MKIYLNINVIIIYNDTIIFEKRAYFDSIRHNGYRNFNFFQIFWLSAERFILLFKLIVL